MMIQGPVFLTFSEKIHQWVGDNTIDGKLHIILLDSHASNMTLHVKFTMANKPVNFQFSEHSSHDTKCTSKKILGGSERTGTGC